MKNGAGKLKVFISYSRRDSEAADALVEALQTRGFEVTIDRRDLPFGEKWQAELAEFIRLSDTVIWLVSEHSIRSQWVNWELDEVAKRNKRLVPVMVNETTRDRLPRQLGEIHILPAEGVFEAARDLGALVQVLETDRGWLKEASRLQDRATEWLAKGRSSALLLSRGALDAALQWKESRPPKAPAPAQEVLDLLLASRYAATWRQRWWLAGSTAATIFALALAAFAYLQRNDAISQRNVTQELREQTQKTESGLLANAASAEFGSSRMGNAVLLALDALPDAAAGVVRPHVPEAEWQLDRANRALQERFVLAHESDVRAAAFSPDGARVLTASADNTARLWEAATGKELARFAHKRPVNAAVFSPGGARVLTASADNTARLWEAATGKELARFAHEYAVDAAAFSPGAGPLRIVTAAGTTVRLWRVACSVDDLVQAAKSHVTRCLTRRQRQGYFLPPAPPVWCITGPGLETEKDPARWQPKWPYQSAEWRDWLIARQLGENPPVPASQ